MKRETGNAGNSYISVSREKCISPTKASWKSPYFGLKTLQNRKRFKTQPKHLIF